MRQVKNPLLFIFFALVLSGCGADDATRNNTFVPLTGIIITSEDNPFIANLTDNQFTAQGNYSGEFNRPITTEVIWGSTDESILTIDTVGLATAKSPGKVTVTATSGDGTLSGSIPFIVTNASIDSPLIVTPAIQTAPVGVERDFDVSGKFDDDTIQSLDRLATWTSLAPTVASVTSTGGATGETIGTAEIQAEWQGAKGSALLEVIAAELVELAITPADAEFPVGLIRQYTLTGTYSDTSTEILTAQAVWDSSIPSRAEANNTAGAKGQVEMKESGTLDISARFNAKEVSTALTINNSTLQELHILATVLDANDGIDRKEIITAGETLTIYTDETVKFTSEAEYTDSKLFPVTTQTNWSSNEGSIVSVSNNTGFEGIASPGIDTGAATITAAFGNIDDFTFTLDVNPR